MKFYKLINYILPLLIIIFLSCSITKVPNEYKKVFFNFKSKLKKMESISVNIKKINSNSSMAKNYDLENATHIGIISLQKQAEYFSKNKKEWNQLFAQFKKVKKSLNGTVWYDDIIFLESQAYIKISRLTKSERILNDCLSSISSFLNLNNDTRLEKWTKNNLENLLWNDLSKFFTKKNSEKENLKQYYYIVRASLLKENKNFEKSLIDYKKAAKISSESIWGVQAKREITRLKEKMK